MRYSICLYTYLHQIQHLTIFVVAILILTLTMATVPFPLHNRRHLDRSTGSPHWFLCADDNEQIEHIDSSPTCLYISPLHCVTCTGWILTLRCCVSHLPQGGFSIIFRYIGACAVLLLHQGWGPPLFSSKCNCKICRITTFWILNSFSLFTTSANILHKTQITECFKYTLNFFFEFVICSKFVK